MDIVNYFADNHAHLLYLIAGISFVVELTVLGFSGPLLFFALGCFLTAILASTGLISGWESEVLSVGLLSAISATLLWSPFKRFQNSGGGPDTSSDMIGRNAPSVSEITLTGGSIRYSGIEWPARLDPNEPVAEIRPNTRCLITGVDGNVMIVKKAG